MPDTKSARIIIANGVYDLSNVKNVTELREEINLLKASIKKDEQDIAVHFRKLPQEAMKASADAVLPSFINKMIANRSWKILASSVGLLANPFSSKLSLGKNVLGGAKKLGMLAVVKGAYNMWKNKKSDKPSKPINAISKTLKPTVKPLK